MSRSYHTQNYLNLLAGLLAGSAAVAISWVGNSLKSHFLCGLSFLVLSVWPAYVAIGAIQCSVANIKSSTARRDRNPFAFWLFVAMTGVFHLLLLGTGIAFLLHLATPKDW
jgi:hypothetical protein